MHPGRQRAAANAVEKGGTKDQGGTRNGRARRCGAGKFQPVGWWVVACRASWTVCVTTARILLTTAQQQVLKELPRSVRMHEDRCSTAESSHRATCQPDEQERLSGDPCGFHSLVPLCTVSACHRSAYTASPHIRPTAGVVFLVRKGRREVRVRYLASSVVMRVACLNGSTAL